MLSRALGHVICRQNLLVTIEQQRHNQENELGGILTLYLTAKLYFAANSSYEENKNEKRLQSIRYFYAHL